MIDISDKTNRLIDAVIPEQKREHIRTRLLEEVSENIPFCEGYSPNQMERIRFSVLRLLFENDIQEDQIFELAYIDWRDLFMSCGHGHDVDAHDKWADSILNSDD